MAALIHEILESIEDGMVLHTCCFAGSLGSQCRELLPKDSRLLTTFVAGSHYEAMTIYHQYLGREPYTSNVPADWQPYAYEWIEKQNSATTPSKSPADPAALGGFTVTWFELGIVSDSVIAELVVEREEDDDHPEHLRYAAFRRFVDLNRPLQHDHCWQLYRLGASDSDIAMGGAMMADILRLSECPYDLLKVARTSARKHVTKTADQRLHSLPRK